MRASWFVRSTTAAFVLAAASTAASCGRTGLVVFDPCDDEGAERACDDACGSGTQLCEGGTWGACDVPITTRACQNDCGSGSQRCEDGRWNACDVPLVARACTNVCGEGSETCAAGRWGECEVPPLDFPCENACGSGVQRCADGRFDRCEVPPLARDCESVCGFGHETCVGGAWLPCDAPLPNPPVLQTVIRDFSPTTSKDFERDRRGVPGDDRAIVTDTLGPDDKPVWSGDPSIHTVESQASFDQWYRDVPGVNVRIDSELALEASREKPGFFVYDNQRFFPIDGQGFGNEGRQHNYHFTLEGKLTFKYTGGELFSFTGDDDMWVFINRRLAINLGGLHVPESASVSLDERSAELGLVHGETYPINIFFAERHTVQSTFKLETSVADQGSCP
jgi:fibro-slime domain-containing protein